MHCGLVKDPSGVTPLVAPESFWNATAAKRAEVCNGCGAKSGISKYLVPNHMWGLAVKPACNIHDWMYSEGRSEADREAADLRFLCNLLALIEHSHQECRCHRALRPARFLVRVLRRIRARAVSTLVSLVSTYRGLSPLRGRRRSFAPLAATA
jgi:hypothetical protein